MSEHLIFIDFGALTVYWYGVFIGSAVFLAALLFALLRRVQGESFSSALTLSLIAMPAALVTARIFYCWFAKASFPDGLRDCVNLLSGGYALYGALLGVLLVLAAYAAIQKKSLRQLLDAAAPAVSGAVCIGRWASLTSGGDIGFALSGANDDGLPFVLWSEAEQSYILWVGFFEGAAALCAFLLTLVIFCLTCRAAKRGFEHGSATLIFMLVYGFSQTILESMRNDSLFMVTLGFVRISQIISILLAIAALVMIIVKGCFLQKPRVYDIILWAVCAGALGVAVYCEFEMNAVVMVRNYIMMGASLGIIMTAALFLFFRNARARASKFI